MFTANDVERIGPRDTEQLEANERQPLRSRSLEVLDEDVKAFIATHGLTHKLSVFGKAALYLQHDADEEQLPQLTTTELKVLNRETNHKWSQPRLLYFVIFLCSLGAVEQGMAQTGMNGANLFISKAFDLDSTSNRGSFILGLINCGLYLGNALIGCWLSEPVNNRFGRRGAIFCASVLCLIGNLGSAFSRSWPILVLCRLILGTGLGLNASTVSVFAAESAPAYIRGGLAVSWQLFTAFGIFLGFVANVALYNLGRDTIWRFQLGAPLIPAVPLLLMVYLCPESPYWLIKRSRYDLAFSSLCLLRCEELQAAIELYSVFLSRRKNEKLSRRYEMTYLKKFKSLFTEPRNRHALFASYVVMLSQQLCGINIISFYSSTIFSSSGFSLYGALWASVIFGLVNFLGAIPAIWTMDTFGRRRLLLWTLPGMALTMALASISFILQGKAQFLSIAVLVYIFCALYSPGMGPVPCAYSAEVYPLGVREVGMSFGVSTSAAWATILSLTFPALLKGLGESGSFALYSVLNVVAWILCWLVVRETKGVILEEMDSVFESSPPTFVRECWVTGLGRWIGDRRHAEGWSQIRQDNTEED